MLLQEFLEEFADELESALGSSSAGSGSSPLRVFHDPARETANAGEVLIGVGAWGDTANPAQHAGICLTNKGTAGRFGRAQDFATVTDLVLDPPAKLEAHWNACAADWPDLATLFKRITLVAEDAGPDSCFAFLCWLARQRGVAIVELRAATMAPWLRAVRRWETSGMVSEPHRGAWPLLLSALGHSHFFVTDSAKSADVLSEELSQAWVEGLAFTIALLQQGIDPNAVPALWDVPGYRRAISFLDGEYQDYLHSLDHATTLQLYVPLWGSDDRRGLLVDVYFAVETWPSGAKKIFVRSDLTHTYLKQGFALMGLYRPDERLRGSGNDMAVSVNPETGIYLRHLWEELERIETERWEGRRPRGQPRPIASYSPGEGYDQPWWDDFGRYTLLGAPKSVAGGQPGSRLNWADVVDAAWRCYQPLKDLPVNDGLNGGAPCLVHECRRQSFRFDAEAFAITKRLMAVQWRSDTERPSSLLSTPSAKRYLAALLAREPNEPPIGVHDLPEEDEFDYVAASGGFAVLHDRGVLLFDDWRLDRLRVDKLIEEMQRAFELLSLVCQARAELDTLTQELSAKNRRPAPAVLAELAALRARLTEAEHRLQPASHWEDVRRFRKALERRWGLENTLSDLHKRVVQIEDAVRTDSTLKTQRLVSIIASYGLPFFISSAVTGFLAPMIEREAQESPGIDPDIVKVIFYLGLSMILVAAIKLLNRWLLWRHSRQRRVPDTDGK